MCSVLGARNPSREVRDERTPSFGDVGGNKKKAATEALNRRKSEKGGGFWRGDINKQGKNRGQIGTKGYLVHAAVGYGPFREDEKITVRGTLVMGGQGVDSQRQRGRLWTLN